MTENEIVKALKCCGDENNCAECPLKSTRFEHDASCAEELMKTAAELIEKQKAKIEKLEFSNEHWNDWEIKCTAINEFWNKLKAKGISYNWQGKGFVFVDHGDELFEEMAGETNGGE